jgi:hypothetical protein
MIDPVVGAAGIEPATICFQSPLGSWSLRSAGEKSPDFRPT